MKLKLPQDVKAKVFNNALIIEGPKGLIKKKKSTNYIVYKHKNYIYFLDLLYNNSSLKNIKLLYNEIYGIFKGYYKTILIQGIGYKAIKKTETSVELRLGLSHSVFLNIPKSTSCVISKNNSIFLFSNNLNNLESIGYFLKKIKKRDPYKGKGLFFLTETLKQKIGKRAK